ncbi:MAG: peptide ABC transporter substrate-binding protein [Treponema sp.]|nr:peptide ABC transporter substrate-binding protein [Treponema sp.]
MYNPKPLIILLLYIFLIFSCRSAPERIAESGTRDIEYARMRPGIRNLSELTVAFTAHKIELDFRKSYFASEAQIFTGIYEGLFSYHPLTLQPVSALAERWDLSDDKMQWTFTIRRDARFSNGDPVRAEDFRAAWLSLLEPSRNSPYSSFFDVIKGANEYRNKINDDPESVGIIAEDQRTLVVKLNSPASFFPAMLCHHSFSPIHSSMIEKEEWGPSGNQRNWTPPVTNGPYRISSMSEESIVLEKNIRYWDRERIALNKIIVKFTSSGGEASHLWNSGEARWIAGDVDIEALTDLSGLQVNIMFATHYYYVRSEKTPWNDKRVRRAMALVLPWDEIRSVYHLPAKTLIYPISGYPEIEGISESNHGEAFKLMSEAGYEDGVETELVIRIPVSRDAMRVAGIMSTAWKNILKLNVRVEVIPPERYFNSTKEEGFTVGSITWIGDFADPYAFLQMWRNDSNLNDAAFNDPDFEALIERSMIEEGGERLATLAEAEKILLNTGAVLPVCFSPALNIVDTNELEGWYPNPLDIHPFKYLSFKAFRPLPGVAQLNNN